MNNALEVKNLSKKQGDFELKNISFELPKGMILGFIGENGAGKTTTMKAILNIIKKDSGTIKILGKEKNFEEEVGIVLDDSFFPEILTPHDINKIMKSMYKTWDEKMYEKYLKEFNLPKKKEMKAFSKGMRKKLEIITAIAHHPKLLLLDEPTQGLDPIARNEVIKLLQEFIETGENSVLLSSHITTDLEHLADYIIFINKGELLSYFAGIITYNFLSYNNPLILFASISYFLIFTCFKVSNKYINKFAGLMFGVYLIHENNYIKIQMNQRFGFLVKGYGYRVILKIFIVA